MGFDSKSEVKAKALMTKSNKRNVDDNEVSDKMDLANEKRTENIDKIRNELEQRLVRYQELRIIIDKLETNRVISRDKNCQRRKLVAGESKTSAAVYKWKRIR